MDNLANPILTERQISKKKSVFSFCVYFFKRTDPELNKRDGKSERGERTKEQENREREREQTRHENNR